ncbi:hypothetical protein G4O51_01040 [Candidatus Bathyarchaeota archaeon A05DMB-2]|nr:hypothetical protein [Candidatus Bathyarchaeota archaeon A05DMB-2]
MKLKLKAMRAGVWFKNLPRIDRVLFDLTIMVADSIRSVTLANNIRAIVEKLETFLESNLLRVMRGIGLQLAQKISLIAQKWGNVSAKNWSSDPAFVKFLSVMHINQHKLFKMQSTINC